MGEVMNKLTKSVLAAAALATALGGIASPAFAQRDPAYASARAAGQVGERMKSSNHKKGLIIENTSKYIVIESFHTPHKQFLDKPAQCKRPAQ